MRTRQRVHRIYESILRHRAGHCGFCQRQEPALGSCLLPCCAGLSLRGAGAGRQHGRRDGYVDAGLFFFLGFWSVYRILVFSDISGRTGLPVFAVFGLLMGRLGEAAGTLGAALFTGMPLVALSGAVFVLVIVLFFQLYHKLYAPTVPAEVMEQQWLAEYARRFGLSAREQDILSLIVKGMSNAEITGALYITESTVKFHVGNIFKKTGQGSRLEIIADYKRGHGSVC